MRETILPAQSLSGSVQLPGDKSISHRYAMIAAIAEGTSRIANYSTGGDCASTLGCLEGLGVKVERDGTNITIHGAGLDGLRQPGGMLDAGNSGSTIRMLSGILAAQPFTSRISGDESLARRPMDRIMRPLTEMGARIEAHESRFPPLTIHGARLKPLDYELPVPSAQVKTCVLLAGLFAEGETIVREPIRTRDHTELALRHFGAAVTRESRMIRLQGRPRLQGRDAIVPSDLSSAAFFLVAALMTPGSTVSITGVGLNPTRSSLLDFLASMGAPPKILNISQQGGELIGDLMVSGGRVRGGLIDRELTAALIDEIPALAVLGAVSEDGIEVRDAAELRVKETDRIASIAENLGRMGAQVDVREDGFRVPGKQKLRAAELDSFGDHRIAMAFAIAALRADGPCVIENSEAASVSFPEFYGILRELSGGGPPDAYREDTNRYSDSDATGKRD
jgi:3-phosphoshikimate 1-carboxyvinyltransferase